MHSEREPEIVRTEKYVNPADKRPIESDNVNIAVTVIYTEDGSSFTYDKAGNIEVNTEDMFSLFINGVVAVKDNVYYQAVSCTESGVISFAFPVTE